MVTSLLYSECSVWISSIYLVKSLWYHSFSFLVSPTPSYPLIWSTSRKLDSSDWWSRQKGTPWSLTVPTLLLLFSCQVMSDFFRPHVSCSLPGSSVHGISQARTLEWVVISFSRGSSRPRDWTPISCIGRCILYHQATREAPPASLVLCYNPVSWSTHNAPHREECDEEKSKASVFRED